MRRDPSVTAADDADALFQVPLAEFIATRNALASRLNKAGKRDDGERVKALAKPSISAWTANQLYWHHRAAFDRLLASGKEFRRAQASQLAGRSAEMRKPLEARREALSELTRLAADTLTSSGHRPTPEMMRRITTTLEAISIYGDTPGAPHAGRLQDDVDPPGFETLAALVPNPGHESRGAGERSTILPFHTQTRTKPSAKPGSKNSAQLEAERREQRAAAQAAVKAAERSLREARSVAERANTQLKQAAARVKAAEASHAEAEQQLERATAAVTEAKQAARKVATEAESASEAVAEAERILKGARDKVE